MFRCINCKKQQPEGETPFTRTKYSLGLTKDGKSCRGDIIREEKNNCFKCFKKLGAEIK